jgi:hypothetical protein
MSVFEKGAYVRVRRGTTLGLWPLLRLVSCHSRSAAPLRRHVNSDMRV